MSATILRRRVIEHTTDTGEFIHAEAVLDHIEGNRLPHFSITATVCKTEAGYRRYVDSGFTNERSLLQSGRADYELAAELEKNCAGVLDFYRMHLADETGRPMHALANGWYWYDGAEYTGSGDFAELTPHQRAAVTLRVTPAELPEGLDRDAFNEFALGLTARWKADAARALAWLDDSGPSTGDERIAPSNVLVGTADAGYALVPVTRTTIHPAGKHPAGCPLRPDCVAVELETEAGSRWWGFDRAWIGADLRVHVAGYSALNEIVAGWEKP